MFPGPLGRRDVVGVNPVLPVPVGPHDLEYDRVPGVEVLLEVIKSESLPIVGLSAVGSEGADLLATLGFFRRTRPVHRHVEAGETENEREREE